jgi:hypothetical protein
MVGSTPMKDDPRPPALLRRGERWPDLAILEAQDGTPLALCRNGRWTSVRDEAALQEALKKAEQ